MAIGIYDHALVVDQHRQRTWLVGRRWSLSHGPGPAAAAGPRGHPLQPAALRRPRTAAAPTWTRPPMPGASRRSRSGSRPATAIRSTWRGASRGRRGRSLGRLLQDLRALSPAPFAAYLNLPFGRVSVVLAGALPAPGGGAGGDTPHQGHPTPGLRPCGRPPPGRRTGPTAPRIGPRT